MTDQISNIGEKPLAFEERIEKLITDLSISTTKQFKDLDSKIDKNFKYTTKRFDEISNEIDILANATAKRFDEVDKRLESHHAILQSLADNDRLIFDDLKEIKQNVKQLIQSDAHHDIEMTKFNERLEKVENKVGIVHK